MAQVAMQIAGRVYRVACGEGEEAHLGDLAGIVDGKIAYMREKFGEMGDQKLTVMAAVTLADELFEERRRVEALEAALAALRREAAAAQGGREEWVERVVAAVGEASRRIEEAALELTGRDD
ncbi:cell division protein ZapA [Methylocella sp.]|uniref:cell division protein ZapA n=1 Tax=Methylocella sp. TaxID=1978226 RepID=UPI0035B4F807